MFFLSKNSSLCTSSDIWHLNSWVTTVSKWLNYWSMNEGLADDEIKQLKFWKDFGNFCWPQLCCFVRNKRSIEAKALNVRLFKGQNETVWGYFLKLKVIRFVETFSDLWRESFEPSELYDPNRWTVDAQRRANKNKLRQVNSVNLKFAIHLSSIEGQNFLISFIGE